MANWLTQVDAGDVGQDLVGDRLGQVLDWLNDLVRNDKYLSDGQANFVYETQLRLEEFGEAARLTERQYRWIVGLHERLEQHLTSGSRKRGRYR